MNTIIVIKGHTTRYKEVIEILEMLGGKNEQGHNGNNPKVAYYICGDNIIRCDCVPNIYPNIYKCVDYTLEEFLEKFPYKVGDKVQRKGATSCGSVFEVEKLLWEDNQVKYIVNRLWYNNDRVKVTSKDLQPYEETMESKPNLLQQLKEYFDNTPRDVIEKEWHEYDKYNEIGPTVNEYLEYVNKSRQPQYPKTYVECCEVLGLGSYFEPEIRNATTKECNEIMNFMRLKRCRNAYWKIAGEQMGLGRPWEPTTETVYCISRSNYVIKCSYRGGKSNILEFPTEEMRDAFYENFKELIESCKEFL